MTEFTEPLWVIGDLGQLESSPGGSIYLPEPASNMQGPSGFANGIGMMDTRYTFLKDLVSGYAGRVPAFIDNFTANVIATIPMAQSNSNIAALQAMVSGTTLTLASTPVQGISVNIPIAPFTGVLGSLGTATSVTNAPIVMDFGFAWCSTQANASAVTVTDSTLFPVGMPLCIPNAAGTSPSVALLTNVVSIASATVIQVSPVPTITNAQAPVGTAFPWGPSEFASSAINSFYPPPTTAMPYVAFGPGLFLDPRQAIGRAVSFTASASTASVATFTVAGWDIYWQPMTQTVGPFTAASAALTTYTKKAFKAISSITPTFVDSTHSWSSGTSDVIGFPVKTDLFELTSTWWNGISAGTTTGFTVPDFTSPATAVTGDVRGTIQLGALGGSANGLQGGSSNGTVSSGSLTVTGSRLVIFSALSTWNQLNAKLTSPQWQMGRSQV